MTPQDCGWAEVRAAQDKKSKNLHGLDLACQLMIDDVYPLAPPMVSHFVGSLDRVIHRKIGNVVGTGKQLYVWLRDGILCRQLPAPMQLCPVQIVSAWDGPLLALKPIGIICTYLKLLKTKPSLCILLTIYSFPSCGIRSQQS